MVLEQRFSRQGMRESDRRRAVESWVCAPCDVLGRWLGVGAQASVLLTLATARPTRRMMKELICAGAHDSEDGILLNHSARQEAKPSARRRARRARGEVLDLKLRFRSRC